MLRGLPPAEVRRRLPRLCLAFIVIGFAIALTVRADLGLSPWDVLHQGIAERTGLPIGTVAIAVGLVVLLAWIPLGERVAIGTVLNVVLIGASLDLSLLLLPEPTSTATRWAALLVGLALLGPGIAAYLACELGPGPRDGIMTSIVDRGFPLRTVRTLMELAVLVGGALLGGTIGLGTVLFALTIGPNIHLFAERFALQTAPRH